MGLGLRIMRRGMRGLRVGMKILRHGARVSGGGVAIKCEEARVWREWERLSGPAVGWFEPRAGDDRRVVP